MDNSIREKLEQLVNKEVAYEGTIHKISKYKEIGGNICVVTDKRTFQFYPNEIQKEFLDRIFQHNTSADLVVKNEPPAIVVPEENKTIKELLMEAIKKVNEDPNFIKQAKSICDIANTMVNIQKAELDILRMEKDTLN